MATIFEGMGISPMGSGSVPAVDPAKEKVAQACGRLVVELVGSGLRPSDIITRQSLENGIAFAVPRQTPRCGDDRYVDRKRDDSAMSATPEGLVEVTS